MDTNGELEKRSDPYKMVTSNSPSSASCPLAMKPLDSEKKVLGNLMEEPLLELDRSIECT